MSNRVNGIPNQISSGSTNRGKPNGNSNTSEPFDTLPFTEMLPMIGAVPVPMYLGGQSVSTLVDLATIAPGEVDDFTYTNTAWNDGTYNVNIDNFVYTGGDVDFFRFSGLAPGASYAAVTLDPAASGVGTTGSASHQQGDADGDHDADGADFLMWQRQFQDS